MATYVKAYNGYIADVPHFWFKRCDGRIFYFDEQTNASVTPQVNYTEVNAGWSMYPVAYLPGQSTFEMNITSGKFYPDLFSMANATDFESNDTFLTPFTETLDVAADKSLTLSHEPAGDIFIEGLSAEDYTVEGSKVTFTEDQTGPIQVTYEYTQTAHEALIDNKSAAIGEAIMVYPVYGSGDDCTQSAIIGEVVMKVFKARVTGQPGLNGSYKSASTFDLTLSAMDAKRSDGATYSIAYVKKA